MRLEIFYKKEFVDGRAKRLLNSLTNHFNFQLENLFIIDVYLLPDNLNLTEHDLAELFADKVAQTILVNQPVAGLAEFDGWDYLVEIAYKPGVTDPIALTAEEAVQNWLDLAETEKLGIQTARQYIFFSKTLTTEQSRVVFNSLYNSLIESEIVISKNDWQKGKRPPAFYPSVKLTTAITVHEFDLNNLADQELVNFSQEKLLALSLEEMKAIQKHFQNPQFLALRKRYGLGFKITDVELEMIAQTWSEHCKHKIFNALITYTENGKTYQFDSLFKTFIKNTTARLARQKRYLLSVFHDNSGVIRFDRHTSLCFKVETHNSPSALDPYGGAITGIVGVNRDILGTGKLAQPIFNTNVLCFAEPQTPQTEVPSGLLHPRRVLEGVHRGIIDGGNQSGIPTVAGAFIFDQSYLGKPLVFCGTGGILPSRLHGEASHLKHIEPGDLAVMVGGRIGKDGIHGATFSSLALDENSPTSAVQIGDPITQKKMWDFLEEARNLNLFKGITDNGAGGLSSSLGEMAQTSGGVRIELDRCPLKYQGLAPWEILVSESQERMSLAVDPLKIEKFLTLAQQRSVLATVVGEFTNTGYVEICYKHKTVGLLDLKFLHNGLPQLKLQARWEEPKLSFAKFESTTLTERNNVFLNILADPNVSSREALVRQYDHEVQALTIIKPFVGEDFDAPSDGAVLKPRYDSWRGITITHGIAPRLSTYDTYDMACNAVDEAFRAHLALGGDYKQTAALDNFCWPDPIFAQNNPDGEYKLAQLVRACRGLADTCLAYGIPLISGKDSMKNDVYLAGEKISVKPTLLISLIGFIPDVRKAVTTDFKESGDLIFLVGQTADERAGSIYERIVKKSFSRWPKVNLNQALKIYRALHQAIKAGLISACHDISDGGLAVALGESAFGAKKGFNLELESLVRSNSAHSSLSIDALLFSESASRFIISTKPTAAKHLERCFKNLPLFYLGKVTNEGNLLIKLNNQPVLKLSLNEAWNAWQRRIE